MTPDEYFATIEAELETAVDLAATARDRGEDPTDDVEIPVAVDMADRVENILGIEGVADRVRELEDEMSREEAALRLVEDFVDGSVGDYDTPAGTIEGAVRTAVALLTEGVVAAPIEGIDRVEVRENDDGSSFVAVYYAGPIRSAGGTAQALSVLVADYARALLGLDAYHPRAEEVERYVEEVGLYDDETGLQYSPKDAETRYIAQHCPVMLDGEATGQEEVSGYRDLERVDTNSPRGGLCLVLAEGLALKAPKIQRYTRDLDAIDWPWLEDLIAGELGDDDHPEIAATAADDPGDAAVEDRPMPAPSKKYLRDLIAGRPVLGHPSTPGGFRLRYGRARNHGFATAGIHPATMHILDDFLATGTQLKTERPGKAAGVVPVDSIEGPTVRLANGDVRRIDDAATARELQNGVEAILDLGEYLVNYGEFVENNQPLAPAAYTVEWWLQDMAAAGANIQALRDSPHVDVEAPTPDQALAWATDHDAPLHPAYTYLWHDLDVPDIDTLATAVAEAAVTDGALRIDATAATREILETLLVEHHQDPDTLTIPEWRPLAATLGIDTETLTPRWEEIPDTTDAIDAINDLAAFTVQRRAPTRVGARMGRPEKSEQRELSPAVHTLFPIGEAGGSQRDVNEAASTGDATAAARGQITVEVGDRACPACGTHTFRPRCPDCATRTDPHYECPDCGVTAEPGDGNRITCPRCDRALDGVRPHEIDLDELVREAHEAVGERDSAYDILKGVKGLTSTHKTPEPIAKGVLRAKHDVSAFKDGTVRYDMTDLPVTTVRPEELAVDAQRFRELGYDTDIHGDELRHDDQLVELKVQDIILSEGAADHLVSTADFVDDLLERYYDLDPYYEAADRQDLVGELVFGLAPHTSAAVVGRVVGFTSAAVGYAHPYFHAAKRRNCDGDEDCVMLLMDGLLNFSKQYLPDQRGGRMDAPLVMSSRIDPAEIDDEAHNVDVVDAYPREFYEATRAMADPETVDIELAAASVGTDDQYTGFGFTEDTSGLALGPALSAYKTLGSMTEKMDAQLELARKVRAVDESDVAERVIESHFLPDLMGNLRAFARQETRCLDCGRKYRRMPLTGECRECGGTVNLTVHEGSVSKYMDTALEVAEEYGARQYTRQRLEILDRSLESLFVNDKNRQSGIADFM